VGDDRSLVPLRGLSLHLPNSGLEAPSQKHPGLSLSDVTCAAVGRESPVGEFTGGVGLSNYSLYFSFVNPFIRFLGCVHGRRFSIFIECNCWGSTKCNDKGLNIHRLVLLSRSPVFLLSNALVEFQGGLSRGPQAWFAPSVPFRFVYSTISLQGCNRGLESRRTFL
jgi:hypothetical protein